MLQCGILLRFAQAERQCVEEYQRLMDVKPMLGIAQGDRLGGRLIRVAGGRGLA